MRSRPFYFVLWFPFFIASLVISLYALYGFYWMATTKAPEGMSGLGYGFFQVMFLACAAAIPVCIFLAFQHPRRGACRGWIVTATVFFTAAVPAAVRLWPKKADISYQVPLTIVDETGKPLAACEVTCTPCPPSLSENGLPKPVRINDGHLIITKKRGSELRIQLRAEGFCNLEATVAQWVHDVPDYIHKVNLYWKRPGSTLREDMCSASINWRLASGDPLQLIMLRDAPSPHSPYPPYTRENLRELEANRPR